MITEEITETQKVLKFEELAARIRGYEAVMVRGYEVLTAKYEIDLYDFWCRWDGKFPEIMKADFIEGVKLGKKLSDEIEAAQAKFSYDAQEIRVKNERTIEAIEEEIYDACGVWDATEGFDNHPKYQRDVVDLALTAKDINDGLCYETEENYYEFSGDILRGLPEGLEMAIPVRSRDILGDW